MTHGSLRGLRPTPRNCRFALSAFICVYLWAIAFLVTRVAGRAREGNDVADVREARDVSHRPLEAEAEARVRHGAVAAQVAIPGVGVRVEAGLRDAAVEHLEALLALGAADDLADAGRKHVHGGDGL